MDVTTALKLLAAVGLTLLLGWRLQHAYRTERQARMHMLDGFQEVISSPTLEKDPRGMPRLRGLFEGTPLVVSLDADTLALRTLPTLWLEARWARAHQGTVDVLLDQSGTEYFVGDLGTATPTRPPAGWPETAVTRASGVDSAPILEALARVNPSAFPAIKHVLVDRDELRVTMKCARADRQTYRVLRSATFQPDAVKPEIVTQTLTLLRSIEQAIRPVENIMSARG